MNNSYEYDELLIRYLADKLNAEEKNSVESWIHSSEQNRKYFEDLKRVWNLVAVKKTLDQVLDEVNVEEKWKQFLQKVPANEAKVVPVAQGEEWETAYGTEDKPARKSIVYRLGVAVAVAASVLLVVGLGWKLLVQNKQDTSVAGNTGKPADSVLAIMRHEVNTSGKDRNIQLPDGSLMVLADKSEVSYKEPFTDKRDISLTGKAYFKVAKNKQSPFTVISDEVATTALGTEFTVTAFENTRQIIVRLYEGKVVIKPVDRKNWRMKHDYYLSPGQEFVYRDGAVARVRAFKINGTAQKQRRKDPSAPDNPSLPQNMKSPWFMFNNQPLGQVFDQLAALYHVKIVYSKEDVADKYFVGKFDTSDSLDIVLKYITQANKLTFTKEENTYYIRR